MPETEWNGALAQLGERYNGIVEVSGSIPLGSTIHPFYAAFEVRGHFRASRWPTRFRPPAFFA
jgi:hypothetical protein